MAHQVQPEPFAFSIGTLMRAIRSGYAGTFKHGTCDSWFVYNMAKNYRRNSKLARKTNARQHPPIAGAAFRWRITVRRSEKQTRANKTILTEGAVRVLMKTLPGAGTYLCISRRPFTHKLTIRTGGGFFEPFDVRSGGLEPRSGEARERYAQFANLAIE